MSFWQRFAIAIGATPPLPSRKRTRKSEIRPIEPPPHVVLTISGLAPVVSVGDEVDAGQLVARSPDDARWDRRRHSSLTGQVLAISESAITIDGRPPDSASSNQESDDILPQETIIEMAKGAGVVGMGGAMFPTYAKLAGRYAINTVLVNGCESEPYFTCDHRVLTELRDQVERGMKLAMGAVGATRGLIIEREDYYPAGYEKFIVRDHLGRTVPDRGLPRDVGALVLNVQTALALYHAVRLQRPVLDRVITVDGAAVGQPGNYLVPIGTPVGHILDACDTDMSSVHALTAGGPMMGHVIDRESGVTAGTGGILALTAAEVDARTPEPCLRCGRCLDACPIDLPVALLLEKPNPEVLRCMSCGACQYVCPAGIPLVEKMRTAKANEIKWD